MRTCLSCRARLREFRATPERVAALVPPAALVASDGGGPLRSLLESVVGLGDRFHAAAELATGQKLAAVAASAAALAGGGSAIDEFANHQGPPLPAPVQQVEAQSRRRPRPKRRLLPPRRLPPTRHPRHRPRPHPSRRHRPRHPTQPPSSHRRPRQRPPPAGRHVNRRATPSPRRAPQAARRAAAANSCPSGHRTFLLL